MLSKTQAQTIVTAFQDHLRDRVDQFLQAQAANGFVGGVLAYTAQDNTTSAQAVKTELQNLGWTVVVDTTAKTVTIS